MSEAIWRCPRGDLGVIDSSGNQGLTRRRRRWGADSVGVILVTRVPKNIRHRRPCLESIYRILGGALSRLTSTAPTGSSVSSVRGPFLFGTGRSLRPKGLPGAPNGQLAIRSRSAKALNRADLTLTLSGHSTRKHFPACRKKPPGRAVDLKASGSTPPMDWSCWSKSVCR